MSAVHYEGQIIVEVEGYEGELGSIVVTNDRVATEPPCIYCIGTVDPDGVLRFNDWGYATAAEAENALRAARPTT